ncbi:MAG: DUF3887 domain-containing protein [Deltaproteobacteria bacterium]|nr:DUF3887 domain-containing protein [Deltaproteobacteria bacterium]
MSELNSDVQHKMRIRAQALLDRLNQRDYRHANLNFDTMMTSVMPPDKIEEAWTAVTGSIGAFVETTGTRVENQDGRNIVVLTCKFEQATIDTRVVFDAAANISGLFFAPAAKAPDKAAAAAPIQPLARQPSQPTPAAVR